MEKRSVRGNGDETIPDDFDNRKVEQDKYPLT